ncbi:RNA-directed DNA polymerase from mobile element jockey [Chionoecetes opilio]|uniref:RNA-directed DNA polymerase from mobile element jockey n=1 Tax=Chionoecetes opilio TaxID=41210 RepID=A0A8J4YCS0_CHIOP|nr:RNA-directed DNA polymerase from mobile element jockey [Chionoecetes opilio]
MRVEYEEYEVEYEEYEYEGESIRSMREEYESVEQQGRSAADLLLLQSASWNHSLDRGMDTFVVALDIAGAFDRVWRGDKPRSLGVRGALLQLIQDYLQDRTLRVVINGNTSSQQPIHASVPQGSVLGPLLWNVYFNDILQLIPEAQAYADDCTLAFPCDRRDWQDTVCRINLALDNIVTWSGRWQVSLAPDKTQALLISRRQDITNLPAPDIRLEGRSLPLQRSISILGVEFDAGLTFTSHARRVAKNSAWRLSCVRRISHFLDAKGVEVLYKAQVRPLMEYSPLAWSSCPPSYLATQDRVQRRAQRLVSDKRPHHAPDSFQPLQEHRDVAGLCVMHKALYLHTPHLAAIKLPRPPPPLHSTRVAPHRQEQVNVPFSRTEHHLRSFLPRYGRLWNQLVHQTDLHHHASLQDFKRGVNSWLMA